MPLPPHLMQLKGRQFRLAPELQPNLGHDTEDLIDLGRNCSLDVETAVTLQQGHDGLWVPFQAHKATYGILIEHEWAASGPFSGCELAVGRVGADIFVAHISRSTNRPEAVNAFNAWRKEEVWFQGRIQLSVNRYYVCYVFVSGTHRGNLQIVRVDVAPSTPGGTDGVIFNVETIRPAPAATAATAPRKQSCCIVC
jgi:hypothetical protein